MASRKRRALRMAATELLLMVAGVLLVRREIWHAHILDVSLAHWQEGLLLPLAAIDGGITGTYSTRQRNVEHLAAYRTLLRFGTPFFLVLYVACSALCERLAFGVFPVLPDLWRTLGIVIVFGGINFRLWAQMVSPSALASDNIESPVAIAAPSSKETASQAIETSPAGQAKRKEQPASQEEAKPEEEPRTEEEPKSGIEEPAEAKSEQPEAQEVAALVSKIADASSGTPKSSETTALLEDGSLFPSGPYKWLRYPDATGRLIALCGIPMCFNAWLPLLAVPGILILIKWHISDQEAFRISQLGERYLAYRKKTWHIVPYIY